MAIKVRSDQLRILDLEVFTLKERPPLGDVSPTLSAHFVSGLLLLSRESADIVGRGFSFSVTAAITFGCFSITTSKTGVSPCGYPSLRSC